MTRSSPFDLDTPSLVTPADFRRELERALGGSVSVRTFAGYRSTGVVPPPIERLHLRRRQLVRVHEAVVLLAQASMGRVADALPPRPGTARILASPPLALARLNRVLTGGPLTRQETR